VTHSLPIWHHELPFYRPDPESRVPVWHSEVPVCRPDPRTGPVIASRQIRSAPAAVAGNDRVYSWTGGTALEAGRAQQQQRTLLRRRRRRPEGAGAIRAHERGVVGEHRSAVRRQRIDHASGAGALFFASDPAHAIALAADSSRTTHGAPEAVDGCRYLAALVIGAPQGRSKGELLSPLFTPVAGLWDAQPLTPKVHAVASGSFRRREPPAICGTGHVVESLEAALWAFAKSTSFRDGALLAVNLGDDADTTGAVYDQLAGAYYGVEGIPAEWRTRLAKLNLLESFAARLHRGRS